MHAPRKRLWEWSAGILLALTLIIAAGGWWAWDTRRRVLTSQLTQALEQGDVERARQLTRRGADVNAPSSYPALCVAAGEGDAGWVQELLARGAKVDALAEGETTTPLLLAAGARNRILAWRVSAENSGPDQQNWRGSASSQEYRKIVQLLVRHGANADARDVFKHTPLLMALLSDQWEIGLDLTRAGSDPNAKGATPEPPLLLALNGPGRDTLVQELLKRGADPNRADSLGQTPLMRALMFNARTETLRLLLDRGADVKPRSQTGHTAFSLARKKGRKEILALLKQRGARE